MERYGERKKNAAGDLREARGEGGSKKNRKRRMKTQDMMYIALTAAVTAVSAWISIPAAVPFTLQTFAVCLTAGLLGAKRGTASIGIYLLLGLIGIPVFSGFRGGIGVLLSNTGGYLAGFILTTLIVGLCADRFGRKLPALVVSMTAGVAVCYAFGTAWYLFLYMRNTGPIGLGTVLGTCVIPFILPDLAKIAAAAVLAKRLHRLVR